MKRGNVGFQASKKPFHFHRAWHFAEPDVHARFQLVKMPLDPKARLFHKIGREKAVNGCDDPRVCRHIAVTQPQLDYLTALFRIHNPHCTNSCLETATMICVWCGTSQGAGG